LTLADVLASPTYRDLSTPKVAAGDTAVDFELRQLGRGSAVGRGERVRLSGYAGVRPVALVFGSYT
jgi:hypothetical protein